MTPIQVYMPASGVCENARKRLSEETKEKMRIARKNYTSKHPMPVEQREKIRAKMLKREYKPEWGIASGKARHVPISDNYDLLYKMYVIERKSCQTIGNELGYSRKAINNWVLRNGIPMRSPEENSTGRTPSPEIRKKLSAHQIGELHWNWQGGKSYEPYCPKFNDNIKERVRDRFGRKCFLCGRSETDEKLHVHHCDYNKGQGCGQTWNLIALCHSCHAKTNHRRYRWFNLLANYWALEYAPVMEGFQ